MLRFDSEATLGPRQRLDPNIVPWPVFGDPCHLETSEKYMITTNHSGILKIGDPDLNLHLPVESWEEWQPNVYLLTIMEYLKLKKTILKQNDFKIGNWDILCVEHCLNAAWDHLFPSLLFARGHNIYIYCIRIYIYVYVYVYQDQDSSFYTTWKRDGATPMY